MHTPELLGDEQLDYLRELASIGCGHAANSLAQMLDRTVWLDAPDARLIPLGEVADALGGAERPVVGLHQSITGDLQANLLLVLDSEAAVAILEGMVGKAPADVGSLSPFEQSALLELANILSGSYLSALSDMLGRRLVPGLPGIATDMVGSVLDLLLIDVARTSESAVVLSVELRERGGPIAGTMLLLPDPTGLEPLLAKLQDGR